MISVPEFQHELLLGKLLVADLQNVLVPWLLLGLYFFLVLLCLMLSFVIIEPGLLVLEVLVNLRVQI